MCGITACVRESDSADSLVRSLENLEYRGYDSAGVAVKNGAGIEVRKREGKVEQLKQAMTGGDLSGGIGIGHTRWSTHGAPSDENAHPHTACDGHVAVVHNGIIENYERLRDDLEERGHEFTSDTDTEVIPHLVEERLEEGMTPSAAFRSAVDVLEGSYAIAMIHEDVETVFATRSGSPLVLGVGDDANYLASDVPAFLEFTNRVVYLEDGDVAIVTPDSYRVTDLAGNDVSRPEEVVDWAPEDTGKGEFDHYMLKEIHEQPTALRQAIQGRLDGDDVSL